MPQAETWALKISGIVQGVGFRPYLYRLAHELQVSGEAWNEGDYLVARIQGTPGLLEEFLARAAEQHPPAAMIEELSTQRLQALERYSGFTIAPSSQGASDFAPSPDIALCSHCQREMRDKGRRRRGHAFISCTQCGPRFSLIKNLPYGRKGTSMAGYALCPDCLKEYLDPGDPRFHCETQCCTRCGPRLSFLWAEGRGEALGDPLETAIQLLISGGILALKGVGGFQLLCRADSDASVSALRSTKQRKSKPLAVMLDEEMLIRWFEPSPQEASLLQSKEAPIVLLELKKRRGLSDLLSPGLERVGVMLPVSGLHQLLVDGAKAPLVATSCNNKGDPLVFSLQEDLDQVLALSQGVLAHDREIVMPCDDSVAAVENGEKRYFRRARGLVPKPLTLPFRSPLPVLALGSDLKNTFCMVRGEKAYLSQHLGDLGGEKAYLRLLRLLKSWKEMLKVEPEVFACDANPDLISTELAREQPGEVLYVQHHHAHVAAVIAEKGWSGEVLGVAFDGAGLGEDGNVWGGEFLLADLSGYRRVHSLEPVPLPGGDLAAKEPWRMAASYLNAIGGCELARRHVAHDHLDEVLLQLEKGVNSPLGSSMGRLFDAVSSLLGHNLNSYEGEGGARLEALADFSQQGSYTVVNDFSRGHSSTVKLFDEILKDLARKEPAATVSIRFHRAIAQMAACVCDHHRAQLGINRVALAGGCFQNLKLTALCRQHLENRGFEVGTGSEVPCNDGGLSFGQAAVAAATLAAGRRGKR